MDIDLDPLDDIFPERATNNARAGGKFQPKRKPQPRKESLMSVPSIESVQAVDISENELPDLVGPSLVTSGTLETKMPLKNNEDSVSGVDSSNECPLVNPLPEYVVIGKTLGHNVGLYCDAVTPDVNGNWHSSPGKSAVENADIYFGLESLDDLYSQSTTVMASAAGSSPDKVYLSVQLGNEFSTSCPANNDAEGSLTHSEMPTVYVCDTRTAEEGPHIAVVSPLVDSAVRVSNASLSNTCPEVYIAQDPSTCGEAVVSNSDGGFYIDKRSLEIEEVEGVPCLETLDNTYELTSRSGLRSGKFQPKPKVQIEREKPGASTSHPDAVESVPCLQQAQSIPSETECMNEGSIAAFSPNNVVDFPSLRFGDSTSELPVNEGPTEFMEASCSEASLPGDPEAVPEIPENKAKCRKRKTPVSYDSLEQQKASVSGQENEAGRSTRQLRKRKNACELVDESESEALDDGDFLIESPRGSLIDEDENDDGEYQVANELRNRRAPAKSNKAVPQKEKPVRKRKKANEVAEQSTKVPPKKFSHTTRRKRRQVDKVLLETPEDEIDIRSLRIRDIILLAEYRERMSSKEGKTSEAPLSNQSYSNSFADYNEDETFASEQGGSNNDPTNPTVQESSNYTNYQSYMDKTPRSRWSKQDTELFYKAVRQFGSDISMIQQLFPGRTRTQVKLKYKKEERQHPLMLHEALTNRAKDHSHFQLVIGRLQQLAAEDKQNSGGDDSIAVTGVEEEDMNHEINEEVAKPEQVEEGEIEAMEPDISEDESPLKSSDSEHDLCGWSQYKSEL